MPAGIGWQKTIDKGASDLSFGVIKSHILNCLAHLDLHKA